MAKRTHHNRKSTPFVTERKTKLWPVIWCTGESICIAVSRKPAKVECHSGQPKSKEIVEYTQWQDWNSEFRQGYYIDMKQFIKGDKVHCPHCQAPVDFRLFPSHYSPNLVKVDLNENKKNRTSQLPDPREKDS